MCNRAWPIAFFVLLSCLIPVWVYIFRDIHTYVIKHGPLAYCFMVTEYSSSLANIVTIISRGCLILSYLLVLGVTWVKTYGSVRLARENHLDISLSLMTVLLRDGSIYFTIWTILNTLHIAGVYVEPIRYLTIFTDAITSIIVAHFILNLREVASGTQSAFQDELQEPYEELLDSWRVAGQSRSITSVELQRFLSPLGSPLIHPMSCENQLGPRAQCDPEVTGVNIPDIVAIELADLSGTVPANNIDMV
ncbi:hypothetical protein C8Q78DRAFT_685048 [Trametes maxima]|nr:hypothetical protein C8Q78DRAFT_685048 [Trametes maxima]